MGDETSESKQVTVFISYSHDSAAHKKRVRALAEQLLQHGFACQLDQLEKDPPEGWARWSARHIEKADFVLVVFTSNYLEKPKPDSETLIGLGQGRAWEWELIERLLYAKGVACNVIPVIFTSEDSQHIALRLQGNQTYCLQKADGFADLIDRLSQVSWQRYSGLFRLGGFRTAFVPYLNRTEGTPAEFPMDSTSIIRNESPYELPEEFRSTVIEQPCDDRESCRLVHFDCTEKSKIKFTFSKIQYLDYLKSGEHLDDPMPGNLHRTFRQEFARLIPQSDVDLRDFPLTNICGVGLLIVTRDLEVLVCRHSVKSHVYPRRWTFSASGTMRWGAWPHPFTEMIWKCRQETNHQVNPKKLRLIELGADARKLFFECCFVEHTDCSSIELRERLPSSLEHGMLPLSQAGEFVGKVLERCWEPAAEATLLLLATKRHGAARIRKELEKRRSRWKQHYMMDEWDLRASRHGSLAVMSVRYPSEKLESASTKFVSQVLRFMGDEIKGKRVLEVGSGTGRITRELVKVCKQVTCIDLCERMNQRNEEGGLKSEMQLSVGSR